MSYSSYDYDTYESYLSACRYLDSDNVDRHFAFGVEEFQARWKRVQDSFDRNHDKWLAAYNENHPEAPLTELRKYV